GIPLRRGARGPEKQRAIEPSVAERSGAENPARRIRKLGEIIADEQRKSVITPELRALFRSDQITDATRQRDPRPPGFLRQFNRLAREHEAAVGEIDCRDGG